MNYPNQRHPITPQEERNAEAAKGLLLDHAKDYAEKAANANHPQAKLFVAIVEHIDKITDPYWFLDRPRSETAKDTLNKVAKEIMAQEEAK